MAPKLSTMRRPASATSPLKQARAAAKKAAAKAAAKAASAPPSPAPAEELPEQGSGSGTPAAPVAKAGCPEKGPVKCEVVSPAKAVPKVAAKPAAKAKAATGQLEAIPKGDAKQMNYRVKALAKAGETDLLNKLQSCKSQMEKRDFFYNVYSLDPRVSGKSVAKTDLEEDKMQVAEKEGWWTAEVIAEWKGIKVGCNDYDKKVEASVPGLPERPRRDKALAQLGVMEYEYTHQDTSRVVSRKRQLELKEKVEDVDQDTFQAARTAMHQGPAQKVISNKSSSSQPNKGGLPKAQEQEVELEVDWVQNYKDQYKKCKGLLAQVATELHSLEVFKGQVGALPDSEEMKAPLQRQVQTMPQDIQGNKQEFLQKQLTWPKEVVDTEAEEKSGQLSSFWNEMNDWLKSFKKDLSKHKKFLDV